MNFRVVTCSLLLAIFLTGCSTAKLKSTWKDAERIEKVKKVLVVGVAIRKNRRQLFETTLAKKLEAHGVRAIPSFTVFPKEDVDGKATADYIRQKAIDSVIVVKVLHSKAVKQRVAYTTAHTSSYPPVGVPYAARRFDGWYSDYTYWTTTVESYETGYVISNLEANLYQRGNEEMVWTSFVEVEARDDDVSGVNDLAQALVKQMKKDGVF